MTRSFRIEFIRKADEWEKEHRNCGWYDEEAGYLYDSTEFDADANTMEGIFVDLINLFEQFVDENEFEDITVTEITEMPYDRED